MVIDEVLESLEYCFVYVDDVLIRSKSLEEHGHHPREVLSRMAEHSIVLNGEKCMLGVPEVQFLGHMVSAHGIIPFPEKVAAIGAFPRPGTVRQLMSYLGMVNFYGRFIKGAARALKPLTDALCGQLGGTFWRAWFHHHGSGDAVHQQHVAVHVQSSGQQACADYCLPPSGQQHGGAVPWPAESGATYQVQRCGLVGAPALGVAGPPRNTKGGGRSVGS